ncbi:nicotinamide riboside transporter PnuC [Micromonospora sp. DT233]|uniref:nicotinamide riboside transporter PnuC n=1 Tax=Micromonospora sp. DT233 TaxID=3393432 RepID=UPI003CF82248
MTGPLGWLLDAQLHVGGSPVLLREIVGNVFGLLSALLGLRRVVWAWPVGMIGNALLLTVFLGGVFATPQAHDLYGQAGRQVFFFAVSAYGWWRWQRNRRGGVDGEPAVAVAPRWATGRERIGVLLVAVLGTAAAYPVLAALGSWGPLPDAWILTGSLLATYGMARGWVEFWLLWIAVDAVGVPLLLRGGFYPSAAMYLFYGAFCVWGFVSWWRTSRTTRPARVAGRPSYSEVVA